MMWNLIELTTQLKTEIKKNHIFNYRIECTKLKRRESYLSQNELGHDPTLDQSRLVFDQNIFVKISIKKNDKRLGSSRLQFFTSLPLMPQIQKLCELCELSSEECWQLPSKFLTTKTKTNTFHPGIGEDINLAGLKIENELKQNIRSEKNGIFNSAELFISLIERELILSSGFHGQEQRSQIYAEVCFSSDASVNGEEFLIAKMGAHPEQLDFKKMCAESAANARHAVSAKKSETGQYAVLIDAETTGQLLVDAATHFDAQNKYLKLPFVAKGEQFIPNFSGAPFKMGLDPSMDYAFSSHDFNSEGLTQNKIYLTQENQVVDNIISSQIAQYLHLTPTSTVGNLFVEAKTMSRDDLIRSEPKVLEILQFSALFSQARDLTFSSEIRLGRVYDNAKGQVYYVKGGNLSGQFKENFSRVKWGGDIHLQNLNEISRGPQLSNAYYGPEWSLIHNMTLTS